MSGGSDPGAARAGAAFAARRQHQGISQRELARNKIITAANLIEFEKGRSWPREKTRARLEEVVKWPPGELARIHAGATPKHERAIETQVHADAVAVALAAVDVAVGQVTTAADELPGVDDPAFSERAARVLRDLRRVETVVTRAIRSTRGAPEVLRALTTVRERYHQLMTLAATAPGATLGQRLYAARTAAALSAADAAAAMNVEPAVVSAAEAEEFVSEADRRRIAALITDLTGA